MFGILRAINQRAQTEAMNKHLTCVSILSDHNEQVGEPEVGGRQPGDFLSELQQGVHRHQQKGQSQNGVHGGKIETGIMWSYMVPLIASMFSSRSWKRGNDK